MFMLTPKRPFILGGPADCVHVGTGGFSILHGMERLQYRGGAEGLQVGFILGRKACV